MRRHRIVWACLALVACMGKVDRDAVLPAAPPSLAGEHFDQLRVLSYNVKGLPWPIGQNRDVAAAEIAARLDAMRRAGEQPQIVMLQEAFIADAKKIGRAAGYRYLAFGPGPDREAGEPSPPIGEAFARQASWTRGERLSPVMDSGLAVFSDYPIERIERLTFPRGACAGFDCLAAKGALIAWIRVPGLPEPIAVATTHLNSRKSSGVPIPRANAAFAWQFARIGEFARAQIGEASAAIFTGDFNLGGDGERLAAARRIGAPLPEAREAVTRTLAQGVVAGRYLSEALATYSKRTDQQFYRSGGALALEPVALEIPFSETDADPLSDHPGLMVSYRLARAG